MPPRKKTIIEPQVEEVIEPVIETDRVDEDSSAAIAEDTVTFKRSHFYAFVTVMAFAAGILLGYAVWGMDSIASSQASQSSAVVQAPAEEPQYRRYDIPIENSYALGPDDAPITVVEFSDYQCPFCRRWHDEVYQPLLAAYPGQIKLVYRHLPLTSIHPDAFSAAEASMCAGEQDAFWPFHEKLFGREALNAQVYQQYAQELGLDAQAFEACMNDHKYQEAIQADVDFAFDLGVRSTPTFFINGLAVVGAQPLDVFKQVIDKELAGEIPK